MIMTNVIWKLPVPSTSLLDGVAFQQLLGRQCALAFSFEDESDTVVTGKLLFDGVESFKCTYYRACTLEMIETAYDKLVELGDTKYLSDIIQELGSDRQSELKHFMIYFDDGPCYEFICNSFRFERS
jgi:hypothetical protein